MTKVEVVGDDPTEGMVDYLEDRPVDLMVLATHQHSGLARCLYRPVAEPLARQIEALALFVPPGIDGFVAPDTGDVRLKTALIAIDQSPRAALATAATFAQQVGDGTTLMRLLHVGDDASLPRVHLPHDTGNAAFERLIGAGRATLAGIELSSLTDRAVHPDLGRALQFLVRDGQARRLEVRLVPRSGPARWCLLHLGLIRAADGRPEAAIATLEDVSDRRSAEEQMQASDGTDVWLGQSVQLIFDGDRSN